MLTDLQGPSATQRKAERRASAVKIAPLPLRRARALFSAGAIAAALAATMAVAAPASAADLNQVPSRVIAGAATLLASPEGMVVAPDGTIWVTSGDGSILAFAPGVSGNHAPEFDITGAATGLEDPNGIALDSSGNIWVADNGAQAVFEFAAGVTGNQAPIRTLSGVATQIQEPTGIAIGANGAIYVVTPNTNLLEFDSTASGDVPPARLIEGPETELADVGATDVKLRSNGEIVIAGDARAVETFAANASGNVAPLSVISGAAALPDDPKTETIDPAGNLYVDNGYGSGDTISEFLPGASGNAAPVNRITGDATGIQFVQAIASDSAGDIYAANDGPNSENAPTITEYSPLLTVDSVTSPTATTTGGQSITIHGIGFLPDATVTFGGVAATEVHEVSSTEITAVAPAHTAGTVPVTVGQANGTQSQGLAEGFTYIAGLAVTGIDPTAGMTTGLLLLIGGVAVVIGRRWYLPGRSGRTSFASIAHTHREYK